MIVGKRRVPLLILVFLKFEGDDVKVYVVGGAPCKGGRLIGVSTLIIFLPASVIRY